MAGITQAGYGWTLRKICFKIPRRNPYFYIPQKRIFMAEQEEKKRYKFKEMKVYGSLENFFGNQKNYRMVFDESEVCYINVELSLYNILFDEEEWKAKIKIKASEYYENKEMCSLDKDTVVTTDQNIVYIRDGWGTSNPGWWKKGTYKWEVFIDDVLVGTNHFYVTNYGNVTVDNNPYFYINSIKLFESPKGNIPREERKYLTAFNKDTARYISVEMETNNKITHEQYFPLELHFYFLNDVRQLKGAYYWFEHINDKRENILIDSAVVFCHCWRPCDTLRPSPTSNVKGQMSHAASHRGSCAHRGRPRGPLSGSL